MNARAEYLTRQRWFAGGTEITVGDVDKGPWLRRTAAGGGLRAEFLTAVVDGVEQTYSVPAAYRKEPFEGLDNALMDHDGEFFVYDALHDAHARTALLTGFFGVEVPGVRYAGTLPVAQEAATVLLTAEQSNTSFVVDNAVVVKVFRKVGPGHNPDISLSKALTDDDCPSIAHLRGWISIGDVDLAMVSDFVPSATSGWDSARASFRDLLADSDTDPGEAGGDFAAEAERLGATVADVHRRLAGSFGTELWHADQLDELADRLAARAEAAARSAPTLLPYLNAAKDAYDALRGLSEPVAVQRVHGDLHLGQTLRGIGGWVLIDFEGEPAAPLADRLRLDSPLRDLAGMVRSFDYAAQSVLQQTDQNAVQPAARWTERNRRAFLTGYGDPIGAELLRAYEIDKALYEVVYEAAHRPDWADIPIRALIGLLP